MKRREFTAILASGMILGLPTESFAQMASGTLYFASLEDARKSVIPGSAKVIQINRFGVILSYQRDKTGQCLVTRDGAHWSPASTPWLTHWDVAADGTSDDSAMMEFFIEHLDRLKIEGYVPQGHYAISYVKNRHVQNSIVVRCHPKAQFIGMPTSHWISGNATGSQIELSSLPTNTKNVRLVFRNAGRETVWTEGEEYSLDGKTLNLSQGKRPHGPLQSNESIRAVSDAPLFELGSTGQFQGRFEWHGGVINNSKRGFAPARSSGSGLKIFDFGHYSVSGVYFQGEDDYESAQKNGVTDSGLSAIRCGGGEIHGNIFVGQADLGIYISGGSSRQPHDNGTHHSVHSNHFLRCNNGVSAKRDARGVKVIGNTFQECGVGATFYNTSKPNIGGRGIISTNEFLRCGRRAIDLRHSSYLIVANNVITDFGYKLDGTTAFESAIGINLEGVKKTRIHANTIALESFPRSSQVGILLRSSRDKKSLQTLQCIVDDNALFGVNTGIRDASNNSDNIIRDNIMSDVLNPYETKGRDKQP